MSQHDIYTHTYARLNPAQKEAVDTIDGPVMVIAGPGTGKTQIVALRAANILLSTDTVPDNILITTFTEAGVISIQRRLIEIIGPEAHRIRVVTIHGYCHELIQEFPERFLAMKALRHIDDIRRYGLIEELLMTGDMPHLLSDYERYRYVPDVVRAISTLKKESVSPADLVRVVREHDAIRQVEIESIRGEKTRAKALADHTKRMSKWHDLHTVYERYEMTRQDRGYYDYEDMIGYAVSVLRSDEDLRLTCAERAQYIMVDEYQDTNNSQNAIVDLIASASEMPNIMVVGDDDQSIYRFQGANVHNFIVFPSRYQDTTLITLTENYRSIQPILDLATESIAHNTTRISRVLPHIEKSLHANTRHLSPAMAAKKKKGQGMGEYLDETNLGYAPIECLLPGSDLEEKAIVLDRICALTDEGLPPEEIAILVRTNKEADGWIEYLEAHGVRTEGRAKVDILDSLFVKLLLGIFRIVDDPMGHDRELIDLMRSGLLPIQRIDILRLTHALHSINYTRRQKMSVMELITHPDLLDGIVLLDRVVVEELRDAILSFQAVAAVESLPTLFRTIMDQWGYDRYVQSRGSFADLEDLFTLFTTVRSWVEDDHGFGLRDMLERIGLYVRYGISLERTAIASTGGVQIRTAHQAKGLEYDTVIVSGLSHGVWWDRRKVSSFIPMPPLFADAPEVDVIMANEEERRLFFVAVTRARQRLLLMAPQSIGGKVRPISSFLQEISLEPTIPEPRDLAPSMMTLMRSDIHIGGLHEDEEVFLKTFLETYRLSATDLNAFLADPKMFFRNVILRYPFEDTESTSFGRVYHKTLEMFFAEYKKTCGVPEASFLETTFARLLSREILTPDAYDRLMERGRHGLAGWYEWRKESGWTLPVAVEYDLRPRRIMLGYVPLTGKIDLIENGADNTIILIDAKTGSPRSGREMMRDDEEGRYGRQLLFYAVMAGLDPSLRDRAVSGLGIEFVEGRDRAYRRVMIEYTEEDMERMRGIIQDIWRQITDIDMWRTALLETNELVA